MRLLFFALVTGLAVFAAGLRAETLELRADEWCPYNCAPGADQEGYLIDLARQIFPPHGIRVAYILTPWTRALQMAMEKEHVAAPGAYPSQNRHHVFSEEAAGYSVNALVTHDSSSWEFTGYDSLEPLLLGVVQGYEYSNELTAIQQAHPARFVAISGGKPLERLLRMVRLGRIDAAIDDINVMKHLLRKPSLGKELSIGGTLPNGEIVSIAFSPAGPAGKRYSAIFSAGVRELRASGALDDILDPYGMEDWAQKVQDLTARKDRERRN